MTTWTEQVEQRAKLVHSEIAALRLFGQVNRIDVTSTCEHLYAVLDSIYSEDFPLAKAKDSADLFLHVEGSGVKDIPRLSFVSSLFDNMKVQVRDLTKVIAGIDPHRRTPLREIDLGVSGLAKGSLFVGFAVTPAKPDSLLLEDDLLHLATRAALSAIATASQAIVEGDDAESLQELRRALPDPRLRDAALLAIRRIAPSGNDGITSIEVTGQDSEARKAVGTLTPVLRRQIGRLLKKPSPQVEYVSFEGVVREIDLDAQRFELRRVADAQHIRCAYGSTLYAQLGKQLLDARIRVAGILERGADDSPRLLNVDRLVELDSEGDS